MIPDSISKILITSIRYFVTAIDYLILARVLFSWIQIDIGISRIIFELTEPILEPVRKIMNNSALTKNIVQVIDISPILAMVLIRFTGELVILFISSIM